jgi:hypothetical protein
MSSSNLNDPFDDASINFISGTTSNAYHVATAHNGMPRNNKVGSGDR